MAMKTAVDNDLFTFFHLIPFVRRLDIGVQPMAMEVTKASAGIDVWHSLFSSQQHPHNPQKSPVVGSK